ncbi:hypothetical protein RRG08_030408 [Elysia crispata]|uniref:Uncharacterized protein n=1 Tax=Elysia crispata TaxID=231223 RepID=A0AAE0YG73_9GAST|nr:hypothetical protein RRG08_030408 [Elysia crispata]
MCVRFGRKQSSGETEVTCDRAIKKENSKQEQLDYTVLAPGEHRRQFRPLLGARVCRDEWRCLPRRLKEMVVSQIRHGLEETLTSAEISLIRSGNCSEEQSRYKRAGVPLSTKMGGRELGGQEKG